MVYTFSTRNSNKILKRKNVNLNKKLTRNKLLRLILIVLVIAGSYFYDKHTNSIQIEYAGSSLEYAISNRLSNSQVQGNGIVIAVLPDDNDGSRHQKFLVKLTDGHTILIAHNIDLAPRIEVIRKGDRLTFNGEYEWNEKGGVVHWTHHDPQNKHPHGWLEHLGQRYQ